MKNIFIFINFVSDLSVRWVLGSSVGWQTSVMYINNNWMCKHCCLANDMDPVVFVLQTNPTRPVAASAKGNREPTNKQKWSSHSCVPRLTNPILKLETTTQVDTMQICEIYRLSGFFVRSERGHKRNTIQSRFAQPANLGNSQRSKINVR